MLMLTHSFLSIISLMFLLQISLQNTERRKEKLLAKAKAWELEFTCKHHVLKPIKIGISWECNLSEEHCALLSQFAAIAFQPLPIPVGVASPISRNRSGKCWFVLPIAKCL